MNCVMIWLIFLATSELQELNQMQAGLKFISVFC